MNNVVEFSPGRQRAKPPGPLPGREAQILFFTGVRYERLVTLEATASDAKPLDRIAREACEELGLALDLAGHRS